METTTMTKTAPLVRASAVGKEYRAGDKEMVALQGMSLDVMDGEFLSLLGPSGCGKSTALNIMGGLLAPTSGSVTFDGNTVSGPSRDIGMMFQQAVMFPWRTTIDNVLLPIEVFGQSKKKFRAKAEELLSMVGISEFAMSYPWQLSGGMQQRASLCRSLIHEPALLMLDEPFGALDAFTREELWDVLQELWMRRGFTTILVTHDLREAVYLADTVHVMSSRPGRIIATHDVPIERPRRPRTAYEPRFMDIVARIREEIRGERNEQPPAGAHA